MTKVLEVDCDKIWLSVRITLWVLASVAVSCITYVGYNVMINGWDGQTTMCDIDPKSDFCYKIHHPGVPDLFIIGLILDVINCIFFWLVINHKYKIVELRCKN